MNDDTLTLYYYNDGLTDKERRDVEDALQRDELLKVRYETLCRQLQELSEVGDARATPDAHARWHDSIERAAKLERQRRSAPRGVHWPSFAWGSAVVAMLVVGFALGFWFGNRGTPAVGPQDMPVYAATTRTDSGNAFTRGLKVHLQQSRRDLASMPTDMAAERQMLIMSIVQQNRLFERSAERYESDDLARVLRAFEPILLRLAADDITPEEAAKLQAQLAFELNVMLTKLNTIASNDTSST